MEGKASPSSPSTDCDVIVVGAGLAGIAAARALEQRGLSAQVVEARDRVGGRTLNHELSDGTVVEIGGQWVGPTQDRVNEWIAELGLATYPTHDEGEHLFEFKGRLRRYSGTIPRFGPLALADVGQLRWRLERLARKVPLEEPWSAPGARELDAHSVRSWARGKARTRAGRALIDLVCEGVNACDAADISMLHVLFYINSAGGFDALVETGGGAQQDRIVGGSQLIAIRAAEQLTRQPLLEWPVRRIERSGDAVRVIGERGALSARRAIVAMAPVLCGRIDYEPALPPARDQLTQRMPMGSVIKCMAVYDEPFWRVDGLSGQATSEVGPVKVMFDNSPPSGSPGVLLGFLEANAARRLARRPAEERREAVVECFARVFGPRAGEPIEYVDKSWAEDPWSRGCYAGYFPPGVLTSYGHALRESCGPIHWAGTETATVWNGYFDGAIRSGERAAAEVELSL